MSKETKTVEISTGVHTFFVIADEYGREKVKIPIENLRAFQSLMNTQIEQALEQYERMVNDDI